MFAPNWGVELLAALPFLHEITVNGAGAVVETDLLPPSSLEERVTA
jgi:outer membrane protein